MPQFYCNSLLLVHGTHKLFFFCYSPSPNGGLTSLPELTTLMPVDQNARQIHKGGPPWICDQHNVRVTAGDNAGQNTDKGHTPSPGIEIKIPEPVGNRTRAVAGLEGGTMTTTPLRRKEWYRGSLMILWQSLRSISSTIFLLTIYSINLCNYARTMSEHEFNAIRINLAI